MRNKYPGRCYYCGDMVEVGAGHFERIIRTWRTIHAECVFKQRAEKTAHLTPHNGGVNHDTRTEVS